MKKLTFFIFMAFLCLNGYSQITYEKGYYIDNSNHRTDCLIKNKDWENNPVKFNYKLSESSEQQTLTIESVKEFGISDKAKYIRYTVNVDKSSDLIGKMDNNRNPVFTEENVLLKVLVEGKASLFEYNDSGLKRYFFKNDSAAAEQLVYKSYITTNNQIAENNLFRNQLLAILNCPDISSKDILNINYTKNDLLKIFILYNECQNSGFINYEKKEKQDLFNLTLRPGLRSSSLYIENSSIYFNDVDFGNKTSFRFGLEAEIIMPFKKNKWSIFAEPVYQSYNHSVSKVSIVTIGEIIDANIEYESIELSLGIRYYMFLNDKTKLFVNTSIIPEFAVKSSNIEIIRDDGAKLVGLDVTSRPNIAFGLGCKYNDRYSIEMQYQTQRRILDYAIWNSEFKSVSIILGISFF